MDPYKAFECVVFWSNTKQSFTCHLSALSFHSNLSFWWCSCCLQACVMRQVFFAFLPRVNFQCHTMAGITSYLQCIFVNGTFFEFGFVWTCFFFFFYIFKNVQFLQQRVEMPHQGWGQGKLTEFFFFFSDTEHCCCCCCSEVVFQKWDWRSQHT